MPEGEQSGTGSELPRVRSCVACVAGVIEEGEGERGRREKMRGIGERGEGTPATRTPLDSFLRSLANANF